MPKGTVKAPAFVATLTTLTDEVGDGLYCHRMGITAGQCRSAWLGLCDFIFNVLKKNKVSGRACSAREPSYRAWAVRRAREADTFSTREGVWTVRRRFRCARRPAEEIWKKIKNEKPFETAVPFLASLNDT